MMVGVAFGTVGVASGVVSAASKMVGIAYVCRDRLKSEVSQVKMTRVEHSTHRKNDSLLDPSSPTWRLQRDLRLAKKAVI